MSHELVILPDSGPAYWVLGDLYTIKATRADTDRAYGLMELVMYPGSSTPLHCHQHEHEAFQVQTGTIDVQLGDRSITATPGTFVHCPQGIAHKLTNCGTTPAHLLCWVTPGGFEQFFMTVGVPAIDRRRPVVDDTAISTILAVAPQYGLEILAP